MINFILFCIILLTSYFSFVNFADAKDTKSAIWAIITFLCITMLINRMLT